MHARSPPPKQIWPINYKICMYKHTQSANARDAQGQVEFPSVANRSTAIIPEVHCEHVLEARTLFFGVRNYTRRRSHTHAHAIALSFCSCALRSASESRDIYKRGGDARCTEQDGVCLIWISEAENSRALKVQTGAPAAALSSGYMQHQPHRRATDEIRERICRARVKMGTHKKSQRGSRLGGSGIKQ